MSSVIGKGGNVTLGGGRLHVAATPAGIDLTVLCLREDGKVGGDEDFVFYNQPTSPDGAVRLAEGAVSIDLPRVAGSTDRLVVSASVDNGVFGGIPLAVRITEDGGLAHDLPITGLTSETTVILAEVYRRSNTWKLRNVGQGYAAGLAGLATDFGIAVDEEPAAAHQIPVPPPPATPYAAQSHPQGGAPPQQFGAPYPPAAPVPPHPVPPSQYGAPNPGSPAPQHLPPNTAYPAPPNATHQVPPHAAHHGSPAPGSPLPHQVRPGAMDPIEIPSSPPPPAFFPPYPGSAQQTAPQQDPAPPPTPPPPLGPLKSGVNFAKGAVTLMKNAPPVLLEKTPVIRLRVAWESGTDYEAYALVVLTSGDVVHVATFDAKGTPANPRFRDLVRHLGDRGRGDVTRGGGRAEEIIEIGFAPEIAAVIPVAYSAINNGTGSFHKYKVTLSIENGGDQVVIPADQAKKSSWIFTCVPGIIYNRPEGVLIERLEYYSRRFSEHRPAAVLHPDGRVEVRMDKGPVNEFKADRTR